MTLRKNKKENLGPGWGNMPIQEYQKIAFSKESLEALGLQLKRDGYLMPPNDMLTLEKHMEYLRDKGIIRLKKLRPAGMCTTMNDFEIVVKYGMSTRFDEEDEKIRQWLKRKGFVDKAKNMQFLGSIDLVKQYAPGVYREKIKQQEIDMKLRGGLKPLPDTHPEKSQLPDTHPPVGKKIPDPATIDPDDIQL